MDLSDVCLTSGKRGFRGDVGAQLMKPNAGPCDELSSALLQAAQAKWRQLEVPDEALSSLVAMGFSTAEVRPGGRERSAACEN